VPTVSSLQERDPAAIPDLYEKSYRLVFYLAIPAFVFVVVVSPVISILWLGRYEPLFVGFVALLAAGWLVNVLSNPAYVVDLGTGELRWVSIGCLLTAVLNAGLGLLCGRLFGGASVVAASVSSLTAGYAVILAAYHVQHRVPFRALIPPASLGILAASATAIIAFAFFRTGYAGSPFSSRIAFGLAAVVLTIAVLMWIHPMRRRVWNWVTSRAPA
jgi:O-antigen/teichoic acid export membrane protein